LKTKHITNAAQFARADIEEIFARADALSGQPEKILGGKTLAMLFYEASAHTRPSFEFAMNALGGSSFQAGDERNAAGFVDTVRSIAPRVNAIVLRHPDTGAAHIAADSSPVPIINAGDGAGEHPTQALAELHALRSEKGKINGLRIALVGDLKNGRTAHSLALLLAQFDVYVSLVAPAAMSLPYDLSDAMRARGITVEETNDLTRVLEKTDAVILSRVERRFFDDVKRYEKMSQFYRAQDIEANQREGMWLGGTWEGADEILTATHVKTRESALRVRMALLSEIMT
jgi:aspartate carbamoyltransferase